VARTDRRGATPERQISLPDLTPFDGDRLETSRDYDAIHFLDRDFTGQDASDSKFLACRLERCCLDGLRMRRARLVESLLEEVHAASVDLSDSTWRDSHLSGVRLGAVTLIGATWSGIRVRHSKLGFVNLAGARLEDVVFEKCVVEALDARSAQLRSVTFVDCAMDEINLAEATLSKVDLSGARLRSLIGVESLRGAIVSHQQLLDLAPVLAEQLGLEVRLDGPGDGTGRLPSNTRAL
jgi:uncharacterized protein YjbI with pentapeptide repeats